MRTFLKMLLNYLLYFEISPLLHFGIQTIACSVGLSGGLTFPLLWLFPLPAGVPPCLCVDSFSAQDWGGPSPQSRCLVGFPSCVFTSLLISKTSSCAVSLSSSWPCTFEMPMLPSTFISVIFKAARSPGCLDFLSYPSPEKLPSDRELGSPRAHLPFPKKSHVRAVWNPVFENNYFIFS